MNLKQQWVFQALRLSHEKSLLYAGARKILRHQTMTFTLDDSLLIGDAGYTKSKLTMLTKNYLQAESHDIAQQLWARRLAQESYGSVSFTTFNHFVKGGSIDAKRSKRASVFGPCIQSVVLTQLKRNSYAVDIAYRTTELFKKFPADLVFIRDVLLAPFDLPPDTQVTFYFANVTCHPMYFVTLIPQLDDPREILDEVGKRDPYFYNWIVKWTARYLCPEHTRGIEKFSQALRVRAFALQSIKPSTIKTLQRYLRANHPGFTRDYTTEEDEE